MSNAIAALLELSPDPTVVVSGELIIVSANKAFRALAHVSVDALAGRSLASVMGNSEAELRDAVERCCRTSASLPVAVLLKDETGQWSHHRADGLLLERGDSKTGTLVGLRVKRRTGDTTEGFHRLNQELTQLRREILARQEAERALTASEHRFRTLADNISQFAWMADPTGWVSWYNHRWYEYTGTTFEDMQGWGWQKVHHPEHLGHVLRSWREALATGEPWEDTFPLRGRDGTYRWFLSRALPIRDTEGRLEQWFGTNTDITDLREAQASLGESEARFRLMADAAPVLIWVSAPDQRCTYFNQGWLDFTGRTMDQEVGSGWIEGVHPDDCHRCLKTYVGAFERRERFEMEYRLRRFDGEYRWILARGVPRYGQDETFQGYIGTCLDITDRKFAEAAMRISEARYRELVQALPAAVYTCDADGRITLYNHAAADLWGREPEVGKDLWCGSWNIYRPDGTPLPLDECPMAVTLREGRAVRGEEIVIERPDGARRHVLPNPEPMRNETGEVIGAINMLIDITDRKQAEAGLRESEARKSAIFSSAMDCLITMDAEGRVQDFNPAGERMFGYSREQAVGRTVAELIIPARLRDAHWEGFRRYLKTGQAVVLGRRIEMPALRADGQEIPVELAISATQLTGQAPFFTAYLRDLTERKQAEQALANLAAIVTSSDDAIIGKNLDGIVTSWNRAAERLFGYRADEMVGQPVTRLMPPERQNEEPGILERLRKGEAIEHYETIRCRKDGTRLHVSLSVSPVVDSVGRIIGGSKIARDITAQKRTEQALLQSREELRQALEYQESVVSNMGEGLYTVDGRGFVTSINQAAERLLGWTREELMGRNMHDVTHYMYRDGAPFPAGECAVLQVLRHGAPLTNYEDVFIRKDGSFFDVVYSSSPIWTGGKIAGLVVVFRDVSDKKQAEEALQERDRALTTANEALMQQTAALVGANKELESFSYSVSHDLRAPLRTIDGFTRIVIEEHGAHLDAEAQRCLNIVRQAAGRAGELIDDLLELSRLGRQTMQWRSVNMAEVAGEAADDALRLLEGRRIEFIAGDLPPCQGDRRLLKLVWANLVENAFKYTQYLEAARIETGWMPDDTQADAVVYYVKDNGVGFDMKYVHKLFGVFQRLHNKSEFDGTGVGLAIVHRIIQRHGGRVWAEGKVDGGATFYFSLRKAAA